MNKTNYQISFDYLRVAAMLGVLAVHISQHFPVTPFMKNIMVIGMYGVQVFFIISAWLGYASITEKKMKTKEYYINRAFRIIPIYYAAIIAAIIYVECFTSGFSPDMFHLGWLRYFLCLNTILPSNSFWEWNNAFAFWTMTEFALFYISLPLLVKYINNLQKSLIFYIFCIFIAYITPKAVGWIGFHYGDFIQFDSISDIGMLIGYGPFVQFQYFAIGIVGYMAYREKKEYSGITLMFLIGLLSLIINSPASLISALTCLFLLGVNSQNIILTGKAFYLLRLASKYSFHIYLTHALALHASNIISNYISPNSSYFYGFKFTFFIFLTYILCCFLQFSSNIINKCRIY